METENQTETTLTVPSQKTYNVELDATYKIIEGTVTCESDAVLYEQLEAITTNQAQQLELLQKQIEIQQNMYTVTSYIFVLVLAFALIKFFTSFFNSVISC